MTGNAKTFAASTAQVAKAAERELGAFLEAARESFGAHRVKRAADLWIEGLENADCVDAEICFRNITIRAASLLAAEGK